MPVFRIKLIATTIPARYYYGNKALFSFGYSTARYPFDRVNESRMKNTVSVHTTVDSGVVSSDGQPSILTRRAVF